MINHGAGITVPSSLNKKSEHVLFFLWQSYAERHPGQQVGLQLMKVQIFLTQGKVYAACDALKALGDLQYKPGVVSAQSSFVLYFCGY